MIGKRFPIAVAMRLMAIIALNMAVLRTVPVLVLQMPPILSAIVALDLALVHVVVFGRPLRIFYFTFLVVAIFSSTLITALAMRDPRPPLVSLHILEAGIRHYRSARGQIPGVPPSVEFPALDAADQLLTCALAILPALGAGALASWWASQRQGRRSIVARRAVALLQGALIGFGLSWPAIIAADYLFDLQRYEPQAGWWILFVLVTCPVIGGLAVLRSTRLGPARDAPHGRTESNDFPR